MDSYVYRRCFRFLGFVFACFTLFAICPLFISLLRLPLDYYNSPEKVSVTILEASHNFIGWLGREKFSVIVETDGEIYEIRDKDTYYLYCSKIGQSFPAELSFVSLNGVTLYKAVYLSGNYGVDWKVDSLLYKQQNKEVSKKCRIL